MYYMSSTPYVDYTNDAVWVTSRANGGTAEASVWKINVQNGTYVGGSATSNVSIWKLNDIDSSPTPSYDGQFVYVGTFAGTLYAIPSGGGAAIGPYNPPSGIGGIQGLPWPLSFAAVTGATPDTIIFTRTTTIHSVNFNGTSFSENWGGPKTLTGTPALSAPVDDGTGINLYVAASDGKVHKVLVSSGAESGTAVTVAPSGTTLGDPAFDGVLNRIYIGASDGHVYAVAAF
jgi:hypothetical protein